MSADTDPRTALAIRLAAARLGMSEAEVRADWVHPRCAWERSWLDAADAAQAHAGTLLAAERAANLRLRAELAEAQDVRARAERERDAARADARHWCREMIRIGSDHDALRAEVERLHEALRDLDSAIFNDPQEIERAGA